MTELPVPDIDDKKNIDNLNNIPVYYSHGDGGRVWRGFYANGWVGSTDRGRVATSWEYHWRVERYLLGRQLFGSDFYE